MKISNVRWIRAQAPETDAVLAYSAQELARYGRALTGDEWSIAAADAVGKEPGTAWLGVCDVMPDAPGTALTPAPWDDGYAIWASSGGVVISGRNARSVLFGVYALIERQGVRYLRPGRDGEVIPAIAEFLTPDQPVVDLPRYRHRGVCIEGAPSIEHALDMVDWCAKKRMNTVFLQFLSSQYFYNLWYQRPYNPAYADHTVSEQEALDMDAQVIAALKKRGLVLHRVGHGWTSAAFGMPRSGWVTSDEPIAAQYSDWPAELDGVRGLFRGIPINTELCYSNPDAFHAFVETIVRYCEAHPELDVVHVWLSDATNNKCECAGCRELSISDWYAKAINALSEALHHRAPRTRFVFLCYFELLWPPEKVAVSEQVDNAIMMYAPIRRCYGHTLTDEECDDGQPWPRPPLNQYGASAFNAFYVRSLADWRQAFGGDSFDFDYHLMWANWLQLTDTQIARLYHADLQDLKGLGLDGIVSCQSFRVFYPSGLAMTALAEALWNPDEDWDEMRDRYLQAAYGEHADWAGAYLDIVEGYLDTGDSHWRTPPLSTADADELGACAAYLGTSQVELEEWIAQTPDPAQRRSLSLLAHHVHYLQILVRAYQARLEGSEEDAGPIFDQAAEFLRRTEPSYSTEIDTMLALRFLERARQAG